MVELSGLAGAMARLGTQTAKPAFELQFRQMQNTVIGRLNNDIDDIIEKYDRSREVTQLEKERGKLTDAIPAMQKYHFQSYGNKLRLDKIYDQLLEAQTAYVDDDQDGDVLTADEAENLNNLKDAVREKIKDLYYLVHPDVHNSSNISFLKDAAKALDDYTATAGTVDASGTDEANYTNDNRALKDLLGNLVTKTLGAIEATTSTVRVANSMIDDFQDQIANIDVEFVEMQAVDAAAANQEIADKKAGYANMLQAISLSFDMQLQYTEHIASSLHDRSIPAGSIMNLFS